MILVTGSVAYDVILNLPDKFSSYILPDKLHQINVSFATETHKKAFGGTGGNQTYTLALLGQKPLLLSSAGSDFGPYRTFFRKHHIETRYIKSFQDDFTASGFAITDTVNNQIWGFSKAAMRKAVNLSLRPVVSSFGKSDDLFVMVGPNEPLAMAMYIDECIQLKIPFAFDPAFYIPVISSATLKKAVTHAVMVFGNDYEIALLQKKINAGKPLVTMADTIIITTLGEKGSIVTFKDDTNKKIHEIMVASVTVDHVVDPTGAGDAYRSGFLAGYTMKRDITTCAEMGSVAASFAIEQYGTMNHSFTIPKFEKRYQKAYGKKLKIS